MQKLTEGTQSRLCLEFKTEIKSIMDECKQQKIKASAAYQLLHIIYEAKTQWNFLVWDLRHQQYWNYFVLGCK